MAQKDDPRVLKQDQEDNIKREKIKRKMDTAEKLNFIVCSDRKCQN